VGSCRVSALPEATTCRRVALAAAAPLDISPRQRF
jgi:hypothetical protein